MIFYCENHEGLGEIVAEGNRVGDAALGFARRFAERNGLTLESWGLGEWGVDFCEYLVSLSGQRYRFIARRTID